MVRKMLTKAAIGLLLSSSVTVAASADEWFVGGTNNVFLENAHSNFLDANFKKSVKNIKKVLEFDSSSVAEKKNALTLLRAVYKENGKVPVDWKLPAEITDMRVEVVRKLHEGIVKYQFSAKGNTRSENVIKKFQIVRYPDQVIIDREAGIGEWEESVWEGEPEFASSTSKQAAKIPDGLYLLNIELTSGEETHGWFVLSGLNSSESVEVSQPHENQLFTTRNPVMKYSQFTSPEYQDHEFRSSHIHVTRIWPTQDIWEYRWGNYEAPPESTECTIGIDDDGRVTELEDGTYWVSVGFRETTRFGDLKISRYAKTNRLFSVKAD